MFATVTVFKQLDLVRAKTQDHPSMLGTILLYTDAKEETYIFSHAIKMEIKRYATQRCNV